MLNYVTKSQVSQSPMSISFTLVSLNSSSYEVYTKKSHMKIEPRHEIANNVVCATSKASDQPAHMRSLIRAFACRLNIL